MTSLLEAAVDSKKTLGDSLISIFPKIEINISNCISKYKENQNFLFDILKDGSYFHKNPILENKSINENNTYDVSENYFLSKNEIQEFYENGYISKYFKFPFLNETDLKNIQNEYLLFRNYCYYGIYDPIYCKFPDYVGHLYMPSIVKLLYDNYDYIVQKSRSIFNVSEEELFFSVGVFFIDESKKGINLHQDYSYYILDQIKNNIKTSLITFHTAITNQGISNLYLFPNTHKEILHTLPVLKYLIENKIPIEEELAMYAGCMSHYALELNQLPYNNLEVFLLSHLSRYPQIIYILNKYKNNNIVGHEVRAKPGEFILFDPSILHSNGASSGNIDELVKNFEREVGKKNISRLSLAIRVMHTKNESNHFLWMSAEEDINVIKRFFNQKYEKNNRHKVNIEKKNNKFYTVLCNNKISSKNLPYFSVEEIYNLHASSGAYKSNIKFDLEKDTLNLLKEHL